jgi:hypothetical protein
MAGSMLPERTISVLQPKNGVIRTNRTLVITRRRIMTPAAVPAFFNDDARKFRSSGTKTFASFLGKH